MLEFLSLVLAGSAVALLGFWSGWRTHAAKITINEALREPGHVLPDRESSFTERWADTNLLSQGCNTHGAHPHIRGGKPRHCLHCAACHGSERTTSLGRVQTLTENGWVDAPPMHFRDARDMPTRLNRSVWD